MSEGFAFVRFGWQCFLPNAAEWDECICISHFYFATAGWLQYISSKEKYSSGNEYEIEHKFRWMAL